MSTKLTDFELPGEPGLEGDVTYTSIVEDEFCKLELNERLVRVYGVTGYARGDDGREVGVYIRGTLISSPGNNGMRIVKLISAPDMDGGEARSTRFLCSERLTPKIIRFGGSVEVGGREVGFLYEGFDDGSGDWYPIEVEGEESCRVIGTRWKMLAADGDDGSDVLHVLSLNSMEWTRIHTGMALPKKITNIHHIDNSYKISGEFSNGAEFEVTYVDESI
ncbi:MAG: hypothetical protein FJ275_00555 [Planctomycetes bacterium]|nr:hypothetical protein [Planctomycetota bacterium]